MKPNRKQAWVLAIATLLTLILWLFPPIAYSRQLPTATVLPGFGPSFREETATYHLWIGRLLPHQEIWFGMLIPRTVGVWMAALVSLEVFRRSRPRVETE